MKKKYVLPLLTIMISATFFGCGSEESKVISKDVVADKVNLRETTEDSKNVDSEDDEDKDSSNVDNGNSNQASNSGKEDLVPNASKLKGYVFDAEVNEGTVSMTTDIDASSVVEILGEPDNYFEAASCAFNGLDKIYTYEHFEIQTYPDGDTDKIAMILLLDDLVSTPEGVCIGMTQGEMESVYGKSYEIVDGAYVYTKDDMDLTFIITDGFIESIEYDSKVLDMN